MRVGAKHYGCIGAVLYHQIHYYADSRQIGRAAQAKAIEHIIFVLGSLERPRRNRGIIVRRP